MSLPRIELARPVPLITEFAMCRRGAAPFATAHPGVAMELMVVAILSGTAYHVWD